MVSKNLFRCVCIFILILLSAQNISAQKKIHDSIPLFIVGANYSYQIPGYDMSRRFGNSSTIGADVFYKTKNNWLFGVEYNYLFGDSIRETGILDNITTHDCNHYIINGNGEYQIMNIYEKGHIVLGKVGKGVYNFKNNPNSGIYIKAGAGYIEHKIHYYWAGEAPPQLAGNYIKGYDRYTNGLLLSQSIGLIYFGNRGFLNFALDAEVMEGITYNQRSYNFNSKSHESKQRLDVLVGLKIIWFFPVFHTPGSRTYEYY